MDLIVARFIGVRVGNGWLKRDEGWWVEVVLAAAQGACALSDSCRSTIGGLGAGGSLKRPYGATSASVAPSGLPVGYSY